MPIGGSGKTGRGLSRTGQPGGKQTGQRMGHYIEAGGDFERSAKALLADGWTVPYVAVSDPPKIGVNCKYTFGVRLVAGAGCGSKCGNPASRSECLATGFDSSSTAIAPPVIPEAVPGGIRECQPQGLGRGVATRCSGRRVSGKIDAKWLGIVLRGRGGG